MAMITRKYRGMLQLVSRDIRNVFSHNYRKLNDRQSRYTGWHTFWIFGFVNLPLLVVVTIWESNLLKTSRPEVRFNFKESNSCTRKVINSRDPLVVVNKPRFRHCWRTPTIKFNIVSFCLPDVKRSSRLCRMRNICVVMLPKLWSSWSTG